MYRIVKLRKNITENLKKSLQSLDYPESIRLETPSSANFGDIAFPCFSFCKISKKSPQQTAEQIADHLEKPEGINHFTVQGGYINFWFNSTELIKGTVSTILKSKNKYGILDDKNKKVIVEHTSANPNGPLHVGRARNPIIGDTIARLLKTAGYDVETQFYLDDLGKQVA
ncbi:MAG: arginine--tRNA ligase, partial [Candidatus Thermoplasmatota archaeon]|nr:arginine--tRNA ligase [Candidatus Thermoplasmatota archaeon]